MAHSNPITIGMLAHVDAGKTTLSEAILYSAGSIRKLGRVDNQDTFLDTVDMERARGITIFQSRQLIITMAVHIRCLIHLDMLIFRQRRREHCGCLMRQFLL